MKAYISTGLVAETLLAMVRIQSLKCTHLDKLSSGRITYGIRLADAISFAQKLGWLNVEKQEVSFTKKGEYILTQFDGRNVSGELWRKILQEYIYTWKPIRFLYKGIIIKHNKTEPTYTKTSLFLCEKRRFFMARTEKGVVATI